MTKNDLRMIAATACKSEFGFAPAKKDIVLLEASGDGTYIRFKVRNREYRFDSHIMNNGAYTSIWCGDGTIERV